MKPDKQAFSFVEILIVISIIIVLSAVAITGYSKIQEYSTNSKIASSVQAIDSGLSMYQEEKKLYPLPDGNLKYYGNTGEYKHIGFDNDIFGVSGFITQNTLDAQYLQKLPLDPRSNQYYAYGVNQIQKNYQVAGVVIHNDEPTTLVKGIYHPSGSNPQNIIKEYAGPEFINDNSTEYFPYNPQERMLIAHIVSYSGRIFINGNTYDEITTKKWQLMEGDHIIVSTGGIVNIYYSDGSQSEIGQSDLRSDLTFASMRYPNQDNLLTQIRIALNFGKILTKVSQLASKSEFEIYTSNSIASVRGTIFTVIYTGSTSVMVDAGKVELREILTPLNQQQDFIEKIQNIGIGLGNSLTVPPSNISTQAGKTFLEVLPKESKKGCIVGESTTINFPTDTPPSEPNNGSASEPTRSTTPPSTPSTDPTIPPPPADGGSGNDDSSTDPSTPSTDPTPTVGGISGVTPALGNTTETGGKIDGVCSEFDGKFLDSDAEITSYCKTGNKANIETTAGGWTWNCNGENGGGSATCGANKATYSWVKTNNWTACDKSCNGIQKSIFVCTKNDESIAENSKCTGMHLPQEETRGCNIDNCSGKGCDTCPNGYYENPNHSTCGLGTGGLSGWLNGTIKKRYCNNVFDNGTPTLCETQVSNFDCNWIKQDWQGTYQNP